MVAGDTSKLVLKSYDDNLLALVDCWGKGEDEGLLTGRYRAIVDDIDLGWRFVNVLYGSITA